MQVQYTKHFLDCHKKLPHEIKTQFEKQLNFLNENFRHPSLHTKKMSGLKYNIWEARVSHGYRFTFQIENDTIILRKIGTHNILQKP
jgi:mRNA-degrading endonuclease RelE of RelBE toxin-antitoxin system